MNIKELFDNKTLKAKSKTEILSEWLLEGSMTMDELIEFAHPAKDAVKATCIEAIEFATRQNASIANKKCLEFVSQTLTEKAPRVKWESAKVIGNIAHLFPAKLETALKNLLVNSENEGTVVRWSAAFALGEIIKLETKINSELLPAIESIISREEKNSIKKIYQSAIKKLKK